MQLYRLSNSIISRSKGKSAVAAAAYRSGTALKDQRSNVIHDFSQKGNIAWTQILADDQAPAWVWNREELWNRVEAAETRKDSQLARECLLALPNKLTLEQQINLVQQFATEQFVQLGMVADLALHTPKNNPHAHILLTMRNLGEAEFGLKNRTWNQRSWLKALRKAWADSCNASLEAAGIEDRVDHRSLADQGIQRIPQIHLGSYAAQCLKNGTYHPRVERYLEIEQLNAQLAKLQTEVSQTAEQIAGETQRQSERANLVLPIVSEMMFHLIETGRAIACGQNRWEIQQGNYQIFLVQPNEADWELEIWSPQERLIGYTEQPGQQKIEVNAGLSDRDVLYFSHLHQTLQIEQQRLQAEQAEQERQKQHRLQQEQAERERLKYKQEQERLERQRLEQEQLEQLCYSYQKLYDGVADSEQIDPSKEEADLQIANQLYQAAIAQGFDLASAEQQVQLTIGYGGALGQASIREQGIPEAMAYAQAIALAAAENWQQDQAVQILDIAIKFFRQQVKAGQVIERQPNVFELQLDSYILTGQVQLTETGKQSSLSVVDPERGELVRCHRLPGLNRDEWKLELAQNIEQQDVQVFAEIGKWLQQKQIKQSQQQLEMD